MQAKLRIVKENYPGLDAHFTRRGNSLMIELAKFDDFRDNDKCSRRRMPSKASLSSRSTNRTGFYVCRIPITTLDLGSLISDFGARIVFLR
jgi:hypothetical protein